MPRAAAWAGDSACTAPEPARWPSTANGASACCYATSGASERPRCSAPHLRRGRPVAGAVVGVEGGQRRPSRVDLVMVVVGGQVRQGLATTGAEALAVLSADRVQRQPENHGVPDDRLEVEEVADQEVVLVGLRRLVGEQLLDLDVDLGRHGREAAAALRVHQRVGSPGDEYAVHDRLEPQLETDLGPGGHGDQLEPPAVGGGRGALDAP